MLLFIYLTGVLITFGFCTTVMSKMYNYELTKAEVLELHGSIDNPRKLSATSKYLTITVASIIWPVTWWIVIRDTVDRVRDRLEKGE